MVSKLLCQVPRLLLISNSFKLFYASQLTHLLKRKQYVHVKRVNVLCIIEYIQFKGETSISLSKRASRLLADENGKCSRFVD